MGQKFATGKFAKAICDRCGFEYKYNELQYETHNLIQTNLKVCPTCWEPDHPQNQLGRYPVHDAEALRDPRPDFGDDS